MARTNSDAVVARFYQLGGLSLERAVAIIAAKGYERGVRLCIVAPHRVRLNLLDDTLWSFSSESFIPHAIEDESNPERQPVLLAAAPTDRNGASVVIAVECGVIQEHQRFDMVIDFVAGPDQVAASRERYRHYRAQGCVLEYWVQEPNGGWVKK